MLQKKRDVDMVTDEHKRSGVSKMIQLWDWFLIFSKETFCLLSTGYRLLCVYYHLYFRFFPQACNPLLLQLN